MCVYMFGYVFCECELECVCVCAWVYVLCLSATLLGCEFSGRAMHAPLGMCVAKGLPSQLYEAC